MPSINDELSEIAGMYLLPLREIESEVLSRQGAKVLIETPLGFKYVGLELVRYLSNRGVRAYLSSRNTWGACDFSVIGDYDYVLHLGHALPLNILRIVSMNLRVKVERRGSVTVMGIDGGPRVVFAPIYYRPQPELVSRAESIINDFVKVNPDVVVAYALPYLLYAQHVASKFGLRMIDEAITGCFVSFKIPGTVLFIGSGYFYPLTFKFLNPRSAVYLLDVFRGVIEDVEYVYRRYLALKVRAIEEFRKARCVGVVISRKPGQLRRDLVELLVSKLRGAGKEVVVIDADEVSPDVINNLPVDAVVNTACPRVGIDDLDRFVKPVVNAGDVLKRNIFDLNNLLIW
ncbi:MAG: diphthamide synthesis protein [Vulcanisaeta sp.]|nr:diphthamide synthesis protein [Vulcanisaeta sp.]